MARLTPPEVEEAADVSVERLEIVAPEGWDVSIETIPADHPPPIHTAGAVPFPARGWLDPTT